MIDVRRLFPGLISVLRDLARETLGTALLVGIAIVVAFTGRLLAVQALLHLVTWPPGDCPTGEPAYLFSIKITDDAGTLLSRLDQAMPILFYSLFAVVFTAGWVSRIADWLLRNRATGSSSTSPDRQRR